jgi:hypothetical protein
MSSAKNDNDAMDLGRPYEDNEIRLKGILGFAIGLVLLIVITFGLMLGFLRVLKDNARENADPQNPMAMSDKERLPPEPRLQLAPGFGVESEKGRVNLELQAPAAEYRELRAQWEEIWKHGRKDEKTGMVTMLPIDEAKSRFLAQNAKARSDADAAEFYNNSRSYVSDSSAGRLASEKRR